MEAVLRGAGEETGSTIETHADNMGYRWMIVRDDDVDDLAVGINAVSDQLELDGYGDRLLCAVFAFKDSAGADLLHLQLQARHLVPVRARAGRAQRATERELRLKAHARRGPPDRARARPLVPALGHPDLSGAGSGGERSPRAR